VAPSTAGLDLRKPISRLSGFPKCLWRNRIWGKSADWRKRNAVRRSQQ
jgi:hypothetical protein